MSKFVMFTKFYKSLRCLQLIFIQMATSFATTDVLKIWDT